MINREANLQLRRPFIGMPDQPHEIARGQRLSKVRPCTAILASMQCSHAFFARQPLIYQYSCVQDHSAIAFILCAMCKYLKTTCSVLTLRKTNLGVEDPPFTLVYCTQWMAFSFQVGLPEGRHLAPLTRPPQAEMIAPFISASVGVSHARPSHSWMKPGTIWKALSYCRFLGRMRWATDQ